MHAHIYTRTNTMDRRVANVKAKEYLSLNMWKIFGFYSHIGARAHKRKHTYTQTQTHVRTRIPKENGFGEVPSRARMRFDKLTHKNCLLLKRGGESKMDLMPREGTKRVNSAKMFYLPCSVFFGVVLINF